MMTMLLRCTQITVVERMRRQSADPEFLLVLKAKPSENKTSGEPEALKSVLNKYRTSNVRGLAPLIAQGRDEWGTDQLILSLPDQLSGSHDGVYPREVCQIGSGIGFEDGEVG